MAQIFRFQDYSRSSIRPDVRNLSRGATTNDSEVIIAAIRRALRSGHRKATGPIEIGEQLVRFFPDSQVAGEVIDTETTDEGREVTLLVSDSEQRLTLKDAELASCTIAPHKSYAAFLGHADTLTHRPEYAHIASRLKPMKALAAAKGAEAVRHEFPDDARQLSQAIVSAMQEKLLDQGFMFQLQPPRRYVKEINGNQVEVGFHFSEVQHTHYLDLVCGAVHQIHPIEFGKANHSALIASFILPFTRSAPVWCYQWVRRPGDKLNGEQQRIFRLNDALYEAHVLPTLVPRISRAEYELKTQHSHISLLTLADGSQTIGSGHGQGAGVGKLTDLLPIPEQLARGDVMEVSTDAEAFDAPDIVLFSRRSSSLPNQADNKQTVDRAAEEAAILAEEEVSDYEKQRISDVPGRGTFEDISAGEVSGTGENRRVAGAAGERRRADDPGNDAAHGAGDEGVRSLGDGTGKIHTGEARGGPLRGGSDQGGQGEPGASGRDDGEPTGDTTRHRRGDGRGRGAGVGQDTPVTGRSLSPANYTITAADKLGKGGQKAKYADNVAAIHLLKTLTGESRPASPAEKKVLVKYVGWGGIPQVFDSKNAKWGEEHTEIKGLLSETEYAAARASTQNAHYTTTAVVKGIYTALDRMGFDQGRILEPAVGAGHFFGLMPTSLRDHSSLTGVELDPITGQIAALLYPGADIHHSTGFEDVAIPPDYFDAVVGNPPFGSETIHDSDLKSASGFSIHNYFFAKAIDKTRPGGLVAMVVSHSLLDKQGGKQREWMAERARFLGAIRLPNTAFKENAGTEVTTDIIFLQKRKEGEAAPEAPTWTSVGMVEDKGTGEAIPLNQYFIDRPEMMLGEMTLEGTMYRDGMPTLVADGSQDMEKALRQAIGHLPANIYVPSDEQQAEIDAATEAIPTEQKVYGLFITESGAIAQRLPDILDKPQVKILKLTKAQVARAQLVIGVREQLRTLIKMEMAQGFDEISISRQREALNRGFDNVVQQVGPMHSVGTRRIFEDDPDYPLLLSLEYDYEPPISRTVAKKRGIEPRKARFRKADIFSKRVLYPAKPIERVDSAKDALMVSLNETGKVNMPRMVALTGKSQEQVLAELKGVLYNDRGNIVTADAYLSGSVKAKLAEAMESVQYLPYMAENVTVLKQVQPDDIEAVDIDVHLGSPWVSPEYIADFIRYLIDADADVHYHVGRWDVRIRDANNVKDRQTWGVDGMSASRMLPKILSGKEIKVTYKDTDGYTHIDKDKTLAANFNADEIRNEFKDWIWQDAERREALARTYNDTYNTDRLREYDGSHLTFPGMNANIELHPHQKNAIWRMIADGSILLDHTVGAGKTYAMIAAIMESQRMGLLHKPMIVVPNHLVGQWASEFCTLYPNAHVLQTTKKDFEKRNRQLLMSKIATGDWDAVIVPHSSFGFLPLPRDEEKAFYEDQIAEIMAAQENMRGQYGQRDKSIKQLEKTRARYEQKIREIADRPQDNTVNFSELGVDALFVDEAHEFKNLFFATQKTRINGLGNSDGSKKAFDLFVKARMLQQRHGGKGVYFATGTPVSNSIAEMFTMQRYLQHDALKEKGLHYFDAWADVFGNVVTGWELDATGINYKLNSRFSQFVNLPELITMYRGFADVVTLDDLKATFNDDGKVWPVPKIKGLSPRQRIVERSENQAEYMDDIVERMQNMPPDPREDNPLKATNDARKMALDMRLVDPDAGDHPDNKVNTAANDIHHIYQDWDDKKGTQLVFIDLSTPKDFKAAEARRIDDLINKAEAGDEAAIEALSKVSMDEVEAASSRFDVYNELKYKLMEKGIPADEIRFIHEANTDVRKEKLFEDMRRGTVRILLGSTAKMGSGMNVQNKLVALHHLDAPWRPSDIEQREGRIIRQGNAFYEADPDNFEVIINRYATKQTYDARMWQTLEIKSRFIEQVRQGAKGERVVDDIASQAANFAEMKAAATGNPLIRKQVELTHAIRQLEAAAAQFKRREYQLQDTVRRLENYDKRYSAKVKGINVDIAKRDSTVNAPWQVTVGDKVYATKPTGHIDASKPEGKKQPNQIGKENGEIKRRANGAMMTAFLSFVKSGKRDELGAMQYRGWGIDFTNSLQMPGVEITADGKSFFSTYGKGEHFSGYGLLTRIENWLAGFEEELNRAEATRTEDKRQYETARASLGGGFEQQGDLDAAREDMQEVMVELKRMEDPGYVPLHEREQSQEYDRQGHLIAQDTPPDSADQPGRDFESDVPQRMAAAVPGPELIEQESPLVPAPVRQSRRTTAGMDM